MNRQKKYKKYIIFKIYKPNRLVYAKQEDKNEL